MNPFHVLIVRLFVLESLFTLATFELVFNIISLVNVIETFAGTSLFVFGDIVFSRKAQTTAITNVRFGSSMIGGMVFVEIGNCFESQITNGTFETLILR